MPNKQTINPALLEEDEPLTEADIAQIRLQSMQRNNPMLTMPDGTKCVACTQCHQRPLKVARLCQECYDDRMRAADWRAKLNIVKRGKGRPKLVCPWCGVRDKWFSLSDFCCGEMQGALWEIAQEESARERSDDIYSPWGIKPL
jgi:hypothetical protein